MFRVEVLDDRVDFAESLRENAILTNLKLDEPVAVVCRKF